MSKERLEDVKEQLVMNAKLRIDDVNWLIEQAERAQELEETMLDAHGELFRGKRGRALDIIEGWGERND